MCVGEQTLETEKHKAALSRKLYLWGGHCLEESPMVLLSSFVYL